MILYGLLEKGKSQACLFKDIAIRMSVGSQPNYKCLYTLPVFSPYTFFCQTVTEQLRIGLDANRTFVLMLRLFS